MISLQCLLNIDCFSIYLHEVCEDSLSNGHLNLSIGLPKIKNIDVKRMFYFEAKLVGLPHSILLQNPSGIIWLVSNSMARL